MAVELHPLYPIPSMLALVDRLVGPDHAYRPLLQHALDCCKRLQPHSAAGWLALSALVSGGVGFASCLLVVGIGALWAALGVLAMLLTGAGFLLGAWLCFVAVAGFAMAAAVGAAAAGLWCCMVLLRGASLLLHVALDRLSLVQGGGETMPPGTMPPQQPSGVAPAATSSNQLTHGASASTGGTPLSAAAAAAGALQGGQAGHSKAAAGAGDAALPAVLPTTTAVVGCTLPAAASGPLPGGPVAD